ncbi:MAG TPA: hypothetical protein VF950_28270 [Planctomycetota bacterium]
MLLATLLAIQATSEESGSLTVVNAVPGAMVHVLRLPAELKDPVAFARIWSENDDVQQAALAAMPDELARFAPGRIRDLARIGSPQVQALAKIKVDKMGQVEDPKPVVRRTIADIEGIARFQKLAVGTFHVYSTRPMSIDFHRQDVKVEPKGETTLDAAGRPAKPAEPDVAGTENARAVIRVSQGDKALGDVTLAPGKPVDVGGLRLELVDPIGDAERLGKVQLVHRLYGVFVKLDPGFAAGPGEEIVIVRDGKEVARSTVVRVASADETYPDGAIQLSRDRIEIRKGDEIRRPK